MANGDAPTIIFPQVLKTAYKRINKASTFNMRCFPDHLCTGHADSSFCGRPFVVLATGLDGATLFAEFALEGSPLKQSSLDFSPEGFIGDRLAHGVVVFNLACQAWKYAWKSSRYTYETPHVFRVYALDAATHAIIFAKDSSPFIVSSTRNAAPGSEAPSSDILVVLAAMARLVPAARTLAPSMDFEFDFPMEDAFSSDDAFDLDSLDTASVSLNPEDEAKFLAHEQLHNLLDRLYKYMLPQYMNWRNAIQMKADVERYLETTEHITLEQLARDASIKVNARPLVSRPPSILVFPRAEALNCLQAVMDPDECIVDSVTLGGVNDPSGVYVRPVEFINFMSENKSKVGWSPVDVDLMASSSRAVMAALSPTLAFTAFLGPFGHSDMYQLGVANLPADARPTMFGTSASDRLVYMFATNKAFLHAECIVGPMEQRFVAVVKHVPAPRVNFVRVLVRAVPSNEVLRDTTFEFVRIQ